ncbi:deoxyribose-phosphate aldolase [Clostridium gasigenes]|uniref:deoxyribose-phosphate aldolase n=1 Tax=Clostridium gasigenes TaxID=94869 RepID=UPI001C0AABC5|nr:deoxyribose-phosphate aldolase [Clostridium gasigenes]MBU3109403.1 deoxyribose-phosphate aldolase [Clostridium gasigenes]MBU3132100.1 deoxyribose-phosphate aldolase [Clostridium gasigenes]MBU3135937.1 deoxyribose-phosphate aldolase [Clostridium gasigenes]
MNKQELAKMIDHTILKPEATESEIMKLCKEALEYGFASVCINPSMVKKAAIILEGSEVKVCTVIGFPLGATTTEVKVFETKQTIENGATEVDMVINIGKLKENNLEYVKNDIAAVVNAAKGKALTKVIIESCLLTDEEKVKVCAIAKEVGADFVKTSTGFSSGGATKEDIRLMRQTVGPDMGVKASGGVRSNEDAMIMIENGATRIGASASIAICNGTKSNSNY